MSLRSALIRAGTVAPAYGSVLLAFAALDAPALWSPARQTLPDRLAGINVIVED